MSDPTSVLLSEEISLLLTPFSSSGVSHVARIISAGLLVDFPISGTEMLYCQDVDELINYLLNDTDLDAIIISQDLITKALFPLVLPLLKHLEQARLFVVGEMPQMFEDFPDFCYCPTHETLIEELTNWHQQLVTNFHDWLIQGHLVTSDHLNIHLLKEQHKIDLIRYQELNERTHPILGIIYCSPDNPDLRQDFLTTVQYAPQLPLILIADDNPVLLNSCQHFARQLQLKVLLTLPYENFEYALNTILLRYYRRYQRWLNHRTIYGAHHVKDVYQVGEQQAYGLFQWPPRTMDQIKRYYVPWQNLVENHEIDRLVEGVQQAKTIYQLENWQIILVFDGSPPTHKELASVIDLLTLSIQICWIPRSVGQLMNTREQFGITQILIPITVWQELVADQQIFKRWQERLERQQVDIGLLGGHREMLQHTLACGLTLIAEPYHNSQPH